MDLTQYVMGGFMIVGFVNIVQMALDGNWKSFIKALTGLLAGGVAGYFKMFGIPTIEIGILLGFSVSGFYKSLQVLGVKPTGQPNI